MSFDAQGSRVKQRAFIEAEDVARFGFTAKGAPTLTAFRVEFDVAENETHKSSARVTDHPVETGAVISDHVVSEPDATLLGRVERSDLLGQVLVPDPAESL